MKKYFPILFLLTLISLSFAVYFLKIHKGEGIPETTLVKSFNYSGAKVVSSEIYFWGKIEHGYDKIEEMKQLAYDFSKDLGIEKSSSFSIKTEANDIIKKIDVSGNLGNNRLINLSIQSNIKPDSKNEKFISASITQDLSDSGMEETRKVVLKVFEKYKINPKINSCIVGNYDGKLNYDQLNNISKQIFREAEAQKVEGINDKNLISVSAYSPAIEDYIRVNGKKVNLNLAIRYNSYENKTYLWLASPVITTEY